MSLYDLLCMFGVFVVVSLALSVCASVGYVAHVYIMRFFRSRASKSGLGANESGGGSDGNSVHS